jgi:hypothetical protein
MPGRILLALLALALMTIPAVQQAIAFGVSNRFSFGLLF